MLSGHTHNYERFAPPEARRHPGREAGIRDFVVGTGGVSLNPFGAVKPNSQARNSDAHGVLKLTLHPGSYDWKFVPVAGETFTDSGNKSCQRATTLGLFSGVRGR